VTGPPERDDVLAPGAGDETLGLVSIRLIDQDQAVAIVSSSCPDGQTWADGYPTAGDLEAARMLLGDLRAGRRPGIFGPYEILEAATGDVVGGIGFHRPPGLDGSVEVGYSVASSRRNRGYATAAVALMIEVAIEAGARRVVARADPTNSASRRVLEKAGLTFREVADNYARYDVELRGKRFRMRRRAAPRREVPPS